MRDREQFLEDLRQALEDLHDPDRLSHSPLVAAFGLAGRKVPYDALQRILTAAIAGLEPGPDVPATSRGWRIYDLLACRYIQELSVPAVAHQLGLSERHIRREQHAAIEALAYRLEEQLAADGQAAAPDGALSQPAAAPLSPLLADLAWLKTAPLAEPTDLSRAIASLIEMAQPLASKYRTVVEVAQAEPGTTAPGTAPPGLAVHPVALDQILLNLLTVAIRRAAGGRVQLAVTPGRWAVKIQVQARAVPPSDHAPSPEDAASLELARELASLCGGRLVVSSAHRGLAAAVCLPTFERIPVLVIDDNSDALRLLERYVAGTRYRLLSVGDPAQAVSLAQAAGPQIIILDVMMPGIDGWRLLGQLRQHPATARLPIYICTILPQEELALSLGATGFLRKPITQEAFQSALDQAAAHLAPGFPERPG